MAWAMPARLGAQAQKAGAPSEARSRTNAYASSTRTRVCWRSMMWIPLRSMKMKRFIFGFHRRAWCPKWTPDSKSCFMVTTANAFSLDASASRPRRTRAGPVAGIS